MMPLEEAVNGLVGAPNGAGEPEPERVTQAAPRSVLAALRARAQALREEQTITLDVPGYDGYMVARFRAVSLGRLYSKRTDGTTPINPDWTTAADTLALALDEVLMKADPASAETHPLFTDQPAKFDDDLVDALGLEPTERTARAVVVALCGGGPLGESRVWSWHMAYQGWLLGGTDGDTPTESEVVGKAVGELVGK